METIYTLEDGLFPAKTVKELSIAVYRFLEGLGAEPDVKVRGEEVVVTLPDVKDIDIKENDLISGGFFKTRRFKNALKVNLETVERAPWVAHSHWQVAMSYLMLDEAEKALESAMTTLRLDPRGIFANLTVGRIYIDKFNEIDKGLSYYHRAYVFNPDERFVRDEYMMRLMELGRNPEIRAELSQRNVRDYPNDLRSLAGLALSLIDLGDRHGAFRAAQAAATTSRNVDGRALAFRENQVKLAATLAKSLVADEDLSELVERKRREVEAFDGRAVKVTREKRLSEFALTNHADDERGTCDEVVYLKNRKKTGNLYQYYALVELEKLLMRRETLAKSNRREVGISMIPGAWAGYAVANGREIPDESHPRKLKALRDIADCDLTTIESCLSDDILEFFARRRLFLKHPEIRPMQYVAAMIGADVALDRGELCRKNGSLDTAVRVCRVLDAIRLLQYRDLIAVEEYHRLTMRPEDRRIAEELYRSLNAAAESYRPGDEWTAIARIVRLLGCEDYLIIGGLEGVSDERNAAFEAVVKHLPTAVLDVGNLKGVELEETMSDLFRLRDKGVLFGDVPCFPTRRLGNLTGPETIAYYAVLMRRLVGTFGRFARVLKEACEKAEIVAENDKGLRGRLQHRKADEPVAPDVLERHEAFESFLRATLESYCLSDLVLVCYALQGECAHCRGCRKDPPSCGKCMCRDATVGFEEVLQDVYRKETGRELPMFQIPKSVNLMALNLEGLRELHDRVVGIGLLPTFDAKLVLEQSCERCSDHHPELKANGACDYCVVKSAQKVLEIEGEADKPPKCDGRLLKETLTRNLCDFTLSEPPKPDVV